MRIAFIGSESSWYLRDLRRASNGDHQIEPVSFDSLASQIGGTERVDFRSGDLNLSTFDAALVRTMVGGSLEQVVFRMDVLLRLAETGLQVINPPKAIEASVDKYLTLIRLADLGLPVPETSVCQTAEQALSEFERLGQDVVVKPIFGGEGRGLSRIDDDQIAYRAFRTLEQLNSVIYLQKYIPHYGFDTRIFVLGENVYAMRRENESDWRTNVSRGATTSPHDASEEESQMAIAAARAVGADIAGVDILTSREGRPYILEVNAVPGWQSLSRTLQVDIAAQVLRFTKSLCNPQELG